MSKRYQGKPGLDAGSADQDISSSDDDRDAADSIGGLITRWLSNAGLAPERTILAFIKERYNIAIPASGQYAYYPGAADAVGVPAASTHGRSFRVTADIEFTSVSEGVIFAHGSRFGGHALFVKDGALVYVYNFLGIPPEQRLAASAPARGRHIVSVVFMKQAQGDHGESLGEMTLSIDDNVIARGAFRTQTGRYALCEEGLCVGYDGGDAVSSEYAPHFAFSGGKIRQVLFDISDDHCIDMTREAAARTRH